MPPRTRVTGERIVGTDMDTLISAAWLYYHDNLTQAEIADELGLSRPAVVNLLADARSKGVVNISIRPDLLGQLSLAQRMKERFGLKEAFIVPSPEKAETAAIYEAIGRAGALLLQRRLADGQVIATTWGTTLMEMAKSLEPQKVSGLVLAQSVGSLNSGESFSPIRLATVMAEKLGAKCYHLPVPAVVSTLEVKEILLKDRNVHSCLEMARSASLAVVGIGKVSYDATVVAADFFDRMMIDELRAKGAVGDIACRFFDIQGNTVKTGFDDRVISLTLDDMRKVKPVIALAGGEEKVSAIVGGLHSGCIDILITDERTGESVMKLAEKVRPGNKKP